MVNWMVAVDESPDSLQAINDSLQMMNKDDDILFLLSVVQEVSLMYSFTLTQYPILTETQNALEKEAKERIRRIGLKCLDKGVKTVALIASATHVGEMICKAAEKKSIDILVVGRRGLGKVERILVGSTSKYCLEHAPCNVLIVKVGIAQPEIHDDKKEILKAEEEERARRIKEEKDVDLAVKNQSLQNRVDVAKAEEIERQRRLTEEKEDKLAKENAAAIASQVNNLVEEEKERAKKAAKEGKLSELHSKFDVQVFTLD